MSVAQLSGAAAVAILYIIDWSTSILELSKASSRLVSKALKVVAAKKVSLSS